MALISSTLAEPVARRHGIVTADELIGDGFSHRAIAHHVATGALIRVHNGVYRVATSPDTFESRCAAACRADPHAIITGVAAARLWAFRHVWTTDLPHVLVGHDRTPITRGVVLRRSNIIDADGRRCARRRHRDRMPAACVVRLREGHRRRTLRTIDRVGARQPHVASDALASDQTAPGEGAAGARPGQSGDVAPSRLAEARRIGVGVARVRGHSRTWDRTGAPVHHHAAGRSGHPPGRRRPRVKWALEVDHSVGTLAGSRPSGTRSAIAGCGGSDGRSIG